MGEEAEEEDDEDGTSVSDALAAAWFEASMAGRMSTKATFSPATTASKWGRE